MSNSLISIKYERGKTIYLFSKDNSELLREITVKDYTKNMFKDSFTSNSIVFLKEKLGDKYYILSMFFP